MRLTNRNLTVLLALISGFCLSSTAFATPYADYYSDDWYDFDNSYDYEPAGTPAATGDYAAPAFGSQNGYIYAYYVADQWESVDDYDVYRANDPECPEHRRATACQVRPGCGYFEDGYDADDWFYDYYDPNQI